jgi:ribosomal protein L11 methylase PrmA
MRSESARLGASFRDPSGFLFLREQRLFRQVNRAYQADYDRLIGSGLYDELADAALLIRHRETDVPPQEPALAYRVLEPEPVSFISYPYEWSFGQLQAAALATLEIQKRALARGMSLKDSSAYNIQFHRGQPLLIDTLSFEVYREGEPWDAYRQFCQHFLAPLALMAHTDIRLSQLLRVYIDGIPLDLASRLLPRRTRFSFALLSHLHLHAASQKRYADKAVDRTQVRRRMSRTSFLGLIENLASAVRKLSWKPAGTEWSSYYEVHNYSEAGLAHKQRVVDRFLDLAAPQSVWDLGANTGLFSQQASRRGIPTVAFDIDPAAVELNYRDSRSRADPEMLPLVGDLTNPSPALGWSNRERMSLLDRAPADALMALALVHHLAIGNNVPLTEIARFFGELAAWGLVEFVPKQDSQVRRMLATRRDIFDRYDRAGFEQAFGQYFRIEDAVDLQDSERTLYLLKRR